MRTRVLTVLKIS